MDTVTIVDPGPIVCVEFAASVPRIAVGVRWRRSAEKTVSIKSGEDQVPRLSTTCQELGSKVEAYAHAKQQENITVITSGKIETDSKTE